MTIPKMPTPEEIFVNYIKQDLYSDALKLASNISDVLLRKTFDDLLVIAHNPDAELKARKNALFIARSFLYQCESLKNDGELANALLSTECILEPPMSIYL
jgi:hypothetical protein